ncbi:PilZ domain-containing protein [Qipengyuania sp. G39]|uniref:PilZ domain-containing protein n=1 Tax=Qipengyuania profundimaris TaxID=3067652 RepID=A0ABT9HKC4_9SPHN|nr:PilZ domain-containing protein [Qipengyuania sp. G39]MDP4573593.1 PilZ domain-containing protein [Qipengyuania sp. G39]
MHSVETRNVGRDSLFLFAELEFEGQTDPVRVKVRNLSAGGMMAEAPISTARGERLTIRLRNLEAVKGTIAWVQGDRFGISFDTKIDPRVARAPVGNTEGASSPRFTRSIAAAPRHGDGPLRVV